MAKMDRPVLDFVEGDDLQGPIWIFITTCWSRKYNPDRGVPIVMKKSLLLAMAVVLATIAFQNAPADPGGCRYPGSGPKRTGPGSIPLPS